MLLSWVYFVFESQVIVEKLNGTAETGVEPLYMRQPQNICLYFSASKQKHV